MVLRFIKKLNPKDTKRIKEAAIILSSMVNLDPKPCYLNKDFETEPKKDFPKGKNELSIFCGKVGNYSRGKYFANYTSGKGNRGCTPVYSEIEGIKNETRIEVKMGNDKISYQKEPSYDIRISVTSNPVAPNIENVEYVLGPMEDRMGIYLAELVEFFHNKKDIYRNICALFNKNKKLCKDTMGGIFTEDVLGLFSGDWEDKNIEEFSSPQKNINNLIVFQKKRDDARINGYTLASRFFQTFRYRAIKTRKCEIKREFFYTVSLLLDKKDNLVIEFDIDDDEILKKRKTSITSLNESKLFNLKKYEKIIKEDLNFWLKDTIIMANCAKGIFDSISPRILQNFL